MADTTFSDSAGTRVVASWLNDVNTLTYHSVISMSLAGYGAVGDGVTDDTAAFNAAVADASANGALLVLDGTKTYALNTNQIVLPSGLNLCTNGASFVCPYTTTSNTVWILIASNTNIDTLKITVPTGVRRDRLVGITGSNVSIGSIFITSVDVQTTTDANDYGVQISNNSQVRIGYIQVKNYDRAVILNTTSNVSIGGVSIESYVRGIWITNTKYASIGRSRIYTRSVNASASPGHNGVLMSADTDYATTDITLENFLIEDSGEHAIRIAGPATIAYVKLLHPHVVRAGACGIKVLGTDSGSPTSRNNTIIIDTPLIEDCDPSTGFATNRCGIQLQYVDNVQVISPQIKATNTSYCAAYGILGYSVNDLSISNPMVFNAVYDGLYLSGINGDCARMLVAGGEFRANGRHGVNIETDVNTMRRVIIDGSSLDGNTGLGFNITTLGGGNYVSCLMKAKTYGNTAGAGACGSIGWTMEIFGTPDATPISGITAANSSRWSDGTTLNYRKAGSWVAL